MGIKCLIEGCKSKPGDEIIFNVLPKDLQRFHLWTHIFRRDNILFGKRRKHYVCDLHFSPKQEICFNWINSNLRVDAYPDININNQSSHIINTDHLNSQVHLLSDNLTDSNNMQQRESDLSHPGPSKNKTMITDFTDSCEAPCTPEMPEINLPSSKTPKIGTEIRKKFSILSMTKLKKSELTYKTQALYKLSKGLLNCARKLDSKVCDNKKMLKEVNTFTETKEYMSNNIGTVALQFFESQIRLTKHNPRGRRFLQNDKVFALSLLKQRPKCYNLLTKYFALPSRTSLTRLLHTLQMKEGINDILINQLQQAVSNMNPADKICCLMFDEMSIEPNLSDDGFQQNTTYFADHAMVFMIRGIRRKWKQPIAYYFTKNSMKSQQLVTVLKEIISAIRDAGLKVVATVCDQFSANKCAMEILLKETVKSVTQDNIYRFQLNDKEIISVFDTPHLLKGIRNNLMKANLSFKCYEKDQQNCIMD